MVANHRFWAIEKMKNHLVIWPKYTHLLHRWQLSIKSTFFSPSKRLISIDFWSVVLLSLYRLWEINSFTKHCKFLRNKLLLGHKSLSLPLSFYSLHKCVFISVLNTSKEEAGTTCPTTWLRAASSAICWPTGELSPDVSRPSAIFRAVLQLFYGF